MNASLLPNATTRTKSIILKRYTFYIDPDNVLFKKTYVLRHTSRSAALISITRSHVYEGYCTDRNTRLLLRRTSCSGGPFWAYFGY